MSDSSRRHFFDVGLKESLVDRQAVQSALRSTARSIAKRLNLRGRLGQGRLSGSPPAHIECTVSNDTGVALGTERVPGRLT
jgi:hypothetical protein